MRAQQYAGKSITLSLLPVSKESKKGYRAVKVVGEGFGKEKEYTIRCQERTYDPDYNTLSATSLQEHTLKTDQAGRFEWQDVPRAGDNSSHTYYEYGVVPLKGQPPDNLYPSGRIDFNKQGRETRNDTKGVEDRLEVASSWARIAMALGVMVIAYALLFCRGNAPVRQAEGEAARHDFLAAFEGQRQQAVQLPEQLQRVEGRVTAARGDLDSNREERGKTVEHCKRLADTSASTVAMVAMAHGKLLALRDSWRTDGAGIFESLKGRALEIHCARLRDALQEAREQTQALEASFTIHRDYPALGLADLSTEPPRGEEPGNIGEHQRAIVAQGERAAELMDHVREHWLPTLDTYLDATDGEIPKDLHDFLKKINLEVLSPERGALSKGLEHEEKAQGLPEDDVKAGHVIRVIRRGYRWRTTVLRKAEIVVATAR
ncbi:MAG: hypothetical protein KKI08_21110 [Armatimonadetes bacterium]|nr:hypothetical protein [Armatimonadota bacterium]